MVKDEFEFELTKPIEYHHSGNLETGRLLILKAPSQRNAKERTKLQQGFFRAITSVQNTGGDDKKATDNVEIKGSDIVAIMLSSSVDMVAFLEDFRRLLTSGVCLIEGRETLTAALYDKLDPDDVDSILGEYLGNFILSSRLKTLQRK